jgi:hypothetical protein
VSEERERVARILRAFLFFVALVHRPSEMGKEEVGRELKN